MNRPVPDIQLKLQSAVFENNTDRIKELINQGANINFKYINRNTLLIIAIQGKRKDIAQKLLELGTDVTIQNNQGNTALMLAIEYGYDIDFIKQLINASDELFIINNDGADAFVLANNYNQTEVVDELIKHGEGADLEYGDILLASKIGRLDIIERNIEHGGDINHTDDSIKTGLVYAIVFDHPEVAHRLIDAGADLNIQDWHGNTALLHAVRYNDTPIAMHLINAGADLDIQNKNKDTALTRACSFGSTEIAIALIRKGADLNMQNNNKDSALTIACRFNYDAIAITLIRNGADLELADREGNTALLIASKSGNLNIIEELVMSGANIYFTNKRGDTALSLARNNEVKKRLRSGTLFQDSVKRVMRLLNFKDIYKWQNICRQLDNRSLQELKELAKLQEISDFENLSKRELCKELAQKMETKMNEDVSDCSNLNTILGDDVEDILKPLLFKFEDNGKTFCFNILELRQSINSGIDINPFTTNKLPIDDIRDAYIKLQKILVPERLKLIDALQEIIDSPIIVDNRLRQQLVTDLFSTLNYTEPPSSFLESIEEGDRMERLVDQLEMLGFDSTPELHSDDIDTFINELVRIGNISDTHRINLEQAIDMSS